MLLLLNEYGLSHVCGNDEFQNLESSKTVGSPYYYPYLDIQFEINAGNIDDPTFSMKFLFRGYNEDNQMQFRNLFQYLVLAESNGFQGNLLFCFATIFGVGEEAIYDDFLLLKDLVRTNETFIDRKELSIDSTGKRISINFFGGLKYSGGHFSDSAIDKQKISKFCPTQTE